MNQNNEGKWYQFKKGELKTEFKRQFKLYFFTILLAGIVLAVVLNLENILSYFGWIWSVFYPLIIGGCLAFIINLIMNWYAEKVFTPVRIRKPGLRATLSLLASLITIIIVLILVVVLVLPQLVHSADLLVRELPQNYQRFQEWFKDLSSEISPEFTSVFDRFQSDSAHTISQSIGGYVNSIVSSIAKSTYSFASSTMSSFFSFIMSVVFAIYLLIFKRRIYHQMRGLCYTYFSEIEANKIFYFCHLLYVNFANYIYGQMISVFSLFILYVASSFIFRLPYTLMIGTVVSITSLIPLFGIYIGWGIGAVLILTEDPIKALIFTVLIFVLNQVQDNVISPRIVGNTIGLPGVWVLATVIVGGNMFGIPGMIVSIPIAATLYELIRENVQIRLKAQPEKAEDISRTPDWDEYNFETGLFDRKTQISPEKKEDFLKAVKELEDIKNERNKG